MATSRHFYKDPDAVLDFKFDWASLTNGSGSTDWLADGETIDSYTVEVDAGIVLDSDALSDADTSITVWLSGGTLGTRYSVTCHIVTSAGREDDRTITVTVRER